MIPWKVTDLTVSGLYRLHVTFADPEFFAKARLEDGVVVWPNGADIAPDAMYDEILAQCAA